MRNMLRLGVYFLMHSRLKVMRAMSYKFDFLLKVTISLFVAGVGPLVQLLVFTQTRGYPGWTFHQILLFQGILLIALGLQQSLFGGVRETMSDLVYKGNLDRLLLRPYAPIGIILSSGFTLEGLALLLPGAAVIVFALAQLHIVPSIGEVVLALCAMACGVLVFAAFEVFFCCIIVYTVIAGAIGGVFEHLSKFAQFPIQVFPPFVQIGLMTILPLAMIIYAPTQVLLGRADGLIAVGMGASLLFFGTSLSTWNFTLKRYTSAGG